MHVSIRRQQGAEKPQKQELSALSWNELRELAKAAGINTFRMTREQVEQALS